MELCMIKNLLIAYLFTLTNVFAGLPPTTLKGQSDTLKPTTFNFEAPNKQVTNTASATGLIETGNKNELENSSFEHTAIGTAWTVSNATPSANTTTQFEGKKSLSLALTGALSLTQSSTINAARKLGVQMVASLWVKSDDVSDLQLCSMKNGAEDKCTVTGGYVQGSGWRQLTVSFLGNATSNGLKLKSTDTTGTVLVDLAFVGVGSPIVDFTPDMVYSAKVSATGVVSDENTDWINGNCSVTSTSLFTCTYTSQVALISPMNCVATVGNNVFSVGTAISVEPSLNTVTSVGVKTSTNGVGAAAHPFTLTCQKQGADYKTSKAYVASSSDVSYQACTFSSLAWQGLGTVTNNLQCARKGQNLLIKGRFTLGTVSGSIAQLPLPTNFGVLTTSSSIPSASYASGVVFREASSANTIYSVIQLPSVSYVNFAGQLGNTAINPNAPLSGSSLWSNGDTISVPEIAIPIQGWQDSGVIVGSFQGYNETPGASRVETFSVSYAGSNAGNPASWTNCTTGTCNIDQIGSSVSSIIWNSAGNYTMSTSKTYSKLKCSANATTVGTGYQIVSQIACLNCSSVTFATGSAANTTGILVCHGQP